MLFRDELDRVTMLSLWSIRSFELNSWVPQVEHLNGCWPPFCIIGRFDTAAAVSEAFASFDNIDPLAALPWFSSKVLMFCLFYLMLFRKFLDPCTVFVLIWNCKGMWFFCTIGVS